MDQLAELTVDGKRYVLSAGPGENVTLTGDGWEARLSTSWFMPMDGALWSESDHLRVVASGLHCKDDHAEEFTWCVTRDGKVLRDESRAELAYGGSVFTVAPATRKLIMRGGKAVAWERSLDTPEHCPGWPSISPDGHDLRVWVTAVHDVYPRMSLSVFKWRVDVHGAVHSVSQSDFTCDLLAGFRESPHRDAVLAALQPIVDQTCAKDEGYPGFKRLDPRLEIFAAFADRWQMTVHFLFHHRRSCLAQSGSDFDLFYAHFGRAKFHANKLSEHSLGPAVEELITESAAECFDDVAAAARLRSRRIAELRLPEP